jgi:trans-aconitate 2-methyltransferase
MPTWDPDQYLKFTDHRLRPALDLMARIALAQPRRIYDLGCGPGNITRLLAERWPGARVVGVDSSAEMLAKARTEALRAKARTEALRAKARTEVPRATARTEAPRATARMEAAAVAFEQADIACWSPPEPADLLFSNATLHWLDDHAALLPRLAGRLAPGGVLAVQMPDNRHAPSHVLMEEAAGPWRARLAQIRPIYGSVQTADAYYRMLSPVARQLDLWETTYLHVLPESAGGDNPVVEWTRGTALRPYLDALAEPERRAFLAAYAERIAAAYPRQPDGRTLLPFRRIFLVARM